MPQCIGVKRDGTQCKNLIRSGKYCRHHKWTRARRFISIITIIFSVIGATLAVLANISQINIPQITDYFKKPFTYFSNQSTEQPAWSSIMAISTEAAGSICNRIMVWNDNIPPAQATPLPIETVWELPANENIVPILPTDGRSGLISASITNIVKDNSSIQLKKDVSVAVSVQQNLPEDLDIVEYQSGGCGVGDLRFFSPIELTSTSTNYHFVSKWISNSTDGSFFFAESGKPEPLIFPLQCSSPGIYTVKLSIGYIHLNKSGVANTTPAKTFLCPNRFTLWVVPFGENRFVLDGKYVWNGTGYTKSTVQPSTPSTTIEKELETAITNDVTIIGRWRLVEDHQPTDIYWVFEETGKMYLESDPPVARYNVFATGQYFITEDKLLHIELSGPVGIDKYNGDWVMQDTERGILLRNEEKAMTIEFLQAPP